MEKSRKRSEILPPQPAHERGAGERPGAWLFTMLPARRPRGSNRIIWLEQQILHSSLAASQLNGASN